MGVGIACSVRHVYFQGVALRKISSWTGFDCRLRCVADNTIRDYRYTDTASKTLTMML